MPHVNEEIARKATQALSKGDMQTFIGLHNDDVVLHFPGRGPLAGDYKGKDGLVRLFQKQMEMLDSPPQIENHDILASDDHVAGNPAATGVAAAGGVASNFMRACGARSGALHSPWPDHSQPPWKPARRRP